MSDFWRSRRKVLHPVHTRHLDVENGEIGRRRLEAVERGRAVGVGHDSVTFGLKRDRDEVKMFAVVVDERRWSDEPHPCIRPGDSEPPKHGRNVAFPDNA